MRHPLEVSTFSPCELKVRANECDDREWVPAAMDGVWMRPLLFDTVAGAWVNVTRIVSEGFISRHSHPCPVHAHVLSGRWKYAERDWVAEAGDYLFEPPGDIHTLIGLPGGSETLFWISGALVELDEDGRTLAHSDVFTRIEQAVDHFEEVGLGREHVRQFVR